jgi:soluble lytic murein transglycosylase-like protein
MARLKSLVIYLQIALLTLIAATVQADSHEGIDPELLNTLRSAVQESTSFGDAYVAQVWLVDMSKRIEKLMPDPIERVTFLKILHHEATLANLQPELVLAVIHIESRFDRYAISRAGARGLMQIMPFWKNELGRTEDNLFNTAINLRYGTTILAHYLKREKGDLQKALARYNGSTGKTWYPEKVLTAWERFYYVDHS